MKNRKITLYENRLEILYKRIMFHYVIAIKIVVYFDAFFVLYCHLKTRTAVLTRHIRNCIFEYSDSYYLN
jgi:hypothetical protein